MKFLLSQPISLNSLVSAISKVSLITQTVFWNRGTKSISLPVTISECGSQSFQSSDMPWQFEYSQDSKDTENLSSLSNVFQRVAWVEKVQDKRYIEWEDSKEVNYV